MTKPAWKKSSRSGNSLGCVETSRLDDRVGVRDSKNPGTSPVLSFRQSAFRRFVASVKDS